jgi:hypothetical protein
MKANEDPVLALGRAYERLEAWRTRSAPGAEEPTRPAGDQARRPAPGAERIGGYRGLERKLTRPSRRTR